MAGYAERGEPMTEKTDWDEQIDEIFERAESELREIGRRALECGEYAVVERVVEQAKRAARVRRDQPAPSARPKPPSKLTPVPELTRARGGAQYPKFVLESGDLVKIGWSKKNSEEYEHRAGVEVCQAVIARINELADGELLQVDEIGTIPGCDGAAVPSYQIYLCVAWLRWTGLLRRHGRQGYSVPDRLRFTDAAAEALEATPQRK